MAAESHVTSFMDQIKDFWNSFDLKTMSAKIGGSSAQAVEAIIFFALSFAAGLVFKKYLKIIFISSVIAALLVAALHYNSMVTIDWSALKGFFGFTPEVDVQTIAKIMALNLIDWVKLNILATVTVVIGFLLGYRLG